MIKHISISYQDAKDMGIDLIVSTVNGIFAGTTELVCQDKNDALVNLADAAFDLANEDRIRNLMANHSSGCYCFGTVDLAINDHEDYLIPIGYEFCGNAANLRDKVLFGSFSKVEEVYTDVFAVDCGSVSDLF